MRHTARCDGVTGSARTASRRIEGHAISIPPCSYIDLALEYLGHFEHIGKSFLLVHQNGPSAAGWDTSSIEHVATEKGGGVQIPEHDLRFQFYMRLQGW